MGEPAQKRLIRKIDLERFIARIKPHPSPNVSLEQYTTSESVAATLLYLAAYTYGDIEGKRILDLGCGTGRLGLGAAFLGAQSVFGIDIDKTSVKQAFATASNLNLQASFDWVIGDINAVAGRFDTVLQNPPFGVQRRAADRRFLEKAIELGDSVYSLHNHPFTDKALLARLKSAGGVLFQVEPSPFLNQLVTAHGAKIEAVYAMALAIPHMFEFHTKAKQEIVIDLYVIRRNN